MFDAINLTPEVSVVLIGAIVQIIKQIPFFADKKEWLPLISLGIGVGLAYAASMGNPIVAGIMLGLMAIGGYETVTKKLLGKKE